MYVFKQIKTDELFNESISYSKKIHSYAEIIYTVIQSLSDEISRFAILQGLKKFDCSLHVNIIIPKISVHSVVLI